MGLNILSNLGRIRKFQVDHVLVCPPYIVTDEGLEEIISPLKSAIVKTSRPFVDSGVAKCSNSRLLRLTNISTAVPCSAHGHLYILRQRSQSPGTRSSGISLVLGKSCSPSGMISTISSGEQLFMHGSKVWAMPGGVCTDSVHLTERYGALRAR